jgi:hypothetical protein
MVPRAITRFGVNHSFGRIGYWGATEQKSSIRKKAWKVPQMVIFDVVPQDFI